MKMGIVFFRFPPIIFLEFIEMGSGKCGWKDRAAEMIFSVILGAKRVQIAWKQWKQWTKKYISTGNNGRCGPLWIH